MTNKDHDTDRHERNARMLFGMVKDKDNQLSTVVTFLMDLIDAKTKEERVCITNDAKKYLFIDTSLHFLYMETSSGLSKKTQRHG